MYTQNLIQSTIAKTPGEPEFHQALSEVLTSLVPVIDNNPTYQKSGIMEMLVVPERIITFRVPWINDNGKIEVNAGCRVQFNSALGPYKGGIRFQPNVNQSILKFLGFEQTFKNALTGLPIGGGKGGADFNPSGRSDSEIMRFCQSYMTELYKYLGVYEDVPAGDMGVGAKEVGYMYGQYKRITGRFEGVFTGKGLSYGGSLVRTEATGYGLVYLLGHILAHKGIELAGKNVLISGSGNVATHAAEKATQLGAKVVGMSDINGYIHVPGGVDAALLKEITFKQRKCISEYVKQNGGDYFTGPSGLWNLPCDIALPCATQNELTLDNAKTLISNGCMAVAEGANMPCTNDAVHLLQQNGVLFAPGKAANAGGVAVSALEMSQNSLRTSWPFEEVDMKLKDIMKNIYVQIHQAAAEHGKDGDYVSGANIAGFKRLAEAMLAQGAV